MEEGQAIYTPFTLALGYDLVVLRLSNPLVWKCPTSRLLRLYDEQVSGNHLDVGVGTGYYLDRCRFPTTGPRVALMDLSQHSLAYAARRIARLKPETYRCNVLEPVPFDIPRFETIGLTYLLHCVPGSMTEKAVAFESSRAVAAAGGACVRGHVGPGRAARGGRSRPHVALQPQGHLSQPGRRHRRP